MRGAVLCGALLAAGGVALVLGIVAGHEVLGTAGAASMALLTPVQEAWHTTSRRARAVLYGWAALLAAAILASPLAGVVSGILALDAAVLTVWVAGIVRRFL